MKKKWVLWALLIVAVLAALIVYFSKNAVGSKGEIALQESISGCLIEKYGDGVVIYDEKQLTYYNRKLEPMWTVVKEEPDARLAVNGDNILLYSTVSGRAYLIRGGSIITTFDPGQTVKAASVNKNGCVCLLTQERGYKGQCLVFNAKGSKEAEYSYGNTYILKADLASDNRHLVMEVIAETEGGFDNKLVFSDIRNEAWNKEIPFDDMITFESVYDDFVLVKDGDALIAYSKDGKERWRYDCTDKEVESVRRDGKYLTAVMKESGIPGTTQVVTMNKNGRVKGIYESELPVTAMDASGGYGALCLGDEIVLINRRGEAVGSTAASANTENVYLYGKDRGVLDISDTAIMKFFGR